MAITFSTPMTLSAALFNSYLTYHKILGMAEGQKISENKIRSLASIDREFGTMKQEWKNTLLRGVKPEAFKKYTRQNR
jgi:hypothetical protein